VTGDLQRAFICIPLPEPVRDTLISIQRTIREAGCSPSFSDAQHAHLTLLFLGAVPETTAAAFTARMDEIAGSVGPFSIPMGGGGYFGPKRSPKVIWVGVENSPELRQIQAALAGVAGDLGIPLETRPFHPHVTVARIRSSMTSGALTTMISCINNTHFAEVPVNRVLFMNSQLNGSGPRYTIIHQSHLKGQR